MKINIAKLIAFFALFFSCLSYGQSNPGFTYGETPSAAQWNSYFSAKMDYNAGGVPIASGGTGATTASGARTNLGLGTSAIYPVGTSGVAVPLLSTANTWGAAQTFAAITATTVNGNTITTGSGTLSIAGTKTFAASNTMTLAAGADGQTFTFPAASDTVATLAATQTLTGKTLTNPAITSQTLPVTATANWDFSLGGWGTATLVNSISTLTFSNPKAAGDMRWKIVQGGSGSYTIAWPASVKWPGGTAPTLSTAVGKVDVVTCSTFDAGTTYDCTAQLDFH
jgi:hypothetical protein